jgi:hypothetical protein
MIGRAQGHPTGEISAGEQACVVERVPGGGRVAKRVPSVLLLDVLEPSGFVDVEAAVLGLPAL